MHSTMGVYQQLLDDYHAADDVIFTTRGYLNYAAIVNLRR